MSGNHSNALSVFVGSGRNMANFWEDDEWGSLENNPIVTDSLAPPPQIGSFTDTRDGKTYRTTKIGNLTWMAENLNHQTDSSWCYDNADSNCVKYGRLYNWGVAKSACPAGWRLPFRDDWNYLAAYVGGAYLGWWAYDDANEDGYWENVAMKLKSKVGWHSNVNGTDDYGFSALPGGEHDNPYCARTPCNSFSGIGGLGNWWSSTADIGAFVATRSWAMEPWSMAEDSTPRYALSWQMTWDSKSVIDVWIAKNKALSVRCVADH